MNQKIFARAVNVRRFSWIFSLAIFCLLRASIVIAEDRCVGCHKNIKSESQLSHSFTDWERSVHSAHNVSCFSCHGGDPKSEDKAQAHKGILPSTDPSSALYFTHIPDTCGKCHGDILKKFKKSAHFAELNRSGKGPNCLTCHGSMATWILRPEQMEQTCSLCHRKPTQAQAALMSLNLARSTVEKLSASVPNDKIEKDRYESLKKEWVEVLALWHSFDMPQVLERSRHLVFKARELSTNWNLRKSNERKDTPQ